MYDSAEQGSLRHPIWTKAKKRTMISRTPFSLMQVSHGLSWEMDIRSLTTTVFFFRGLVGMYYILLLTALRLVHPVAPVAWLLVHPVAPVALLLVHPVAPVALPLVHPVALPLLPPPVALLYVVCVHFLIDRQLAHRMEDQLDT